MIGATIHKLKMVLRSAKGSARLTAISFAFGVFLAFSPLPGLHLITAFVGIKIWRLNPMVVLGGTFIHNPWTMIPIHLSGLVLGDLLLNGNLGSIDAFQQFPWGELGFDTVFSSSFWEMNSSLLFIFIKPFFVGSFILAMTTSYFAYVMVIAFLKKQARKEASDEQTPI